MNKRKALMAVLLAAGLPFAAHAGTESGFYVGGSVGQVAIDGVDSDELGNVSFDGDDTAYKLFAGYNFGVIPLVDLAIEVGYADFGEPDDNGIKIDANALEAFGLVGMNLGPVGLFGKIGMVNWDADVDTDFGSGSDDGTDPAYGIGARLKFGSLEVRAEYELFDLDVADDVDMISAGLAWTF